MATPPVRVVLASASVGRRNLLLASGIRPSVVVSEVDERAVQAASGIPDSDTGALALMLARAKAADVAERITAGTLGARDAAELGGPPTPQEPVLVVGADSMLSLDGQALGKAADAQEVRSRWARFAGQWGELVTGHVVIELPSWRVASAALRTRILAAEPSPEELEAYIATGEPLAVAGSATIDGYGAAFISRIEGDPGNVIGLSLPGLRLLVAELGHSWTQLWA